MSSPAEPTPTNGEPSPRFGLAGVLPRGLVILLGTAAAVIVVAGMRAGAWLIAPTFLALVIIIATSPVQTWLRRRGFPQWLSTLALIVLAYTVVIGLALVIAVSVARLATILPQYAGRADAIAANLGQALAKFGIGPEQLHAAAGKLNYGQLVAFASSLLSSLAGVGTNLLFLLALLLFIGVETGGVGTRLAAIAADRPEVVSALGDFARGTRSYLLVSTVFGAIVAALDTVALALLGVPGAVLWGLLAFVTNYIPNIGFVIGLAPPAILGLLQGGWQLMVIVIVLYLVLNSVVQSIIQPRFVGEAVGLSITVTLLSLIFWTWTIGPLGAVLAIPLTLLAKALLVDVDVRARWVDALLVSDRVSQERHTRDISSSSA